MLVVNTHFQGFILFFLIDWIEKQNSIVGAAIPLSPFGPLFFCCDWEKKTPFAHYLRILFIFLLLLSCQSDQNSALLVNCGGRGPCGGQPLCVFCACVRKRDGRTETDAGRLFPGWHKSPAFLIEGGNAPREDQFSESSVHNILSRELWRIHKDARCQSFGNTGLCPFVFCTFEVWALEN